MDKKYIYLHIQFERKTELFWMARAAKEDMLMPALTSNGQRKEKC